MSVSLSPNARKMVPSAIPAASAISLEVTSRPCSSRSSVVTAMIWSCRCSSDIGFARAVVITASPYLSEYSLSNFD